jgi:hypothetical protein
MQKRLTAQPTRKTKMAMLSLAILLALQGYSGIVQAEGNEDFIWKLQGRQWHVNLGVSTALASLSSCQAKLLSSSCCRAKNFFWATVSSG